MGRLSGVGLGLAGKALQVALGGAGGGEVGNGGVEVVGLGQF